MTSPLRRSISRAVAAAGLLATLLVAATVPGVAAATPDEPTCAGHWPATVQGKPTIYQSGGRAGDYIWHSSTGWHLRVTKVTTATAVFSGKIHADKPMSVAGVALESEDKITISGDRKTIWYRFVNHGSIDGIDFKTACANRLTFTGAMDGTALPISRIWIGVNGRHPLQNPFVVARVR